MQADCCFSRIPFGRIETFGLECLRPMNDNAAPWREIASWDIDDMISFEVYAAILFGVIPPEAAPHGFDAGPVPRLVRGVTPGGSVMNHFRWPPFES